MANGGGDHHPPPTANGGGDHRPPPPPPPVSAERNGDDDGHAAPRGGRDWRDYAHAARNGERIDPSVRPPAASLNGGTATSPVSGSPNDDAEKGFGAFRPLDDMEVDNWYTVEFFVAPSKTGLAEEAEGRELTAPSPIWVGRWMRVTLLKDPSFEIRAKTDAEKPTGRDRQASWQWDVRPLTGGERTLYAKVEVLKRNADGSFETIETRTRQVAVKVEVGTWRGFLIALKNAASLGEALSTLFAAWEKTLLALAALITALGGLLVAVRKLRGKKPARRRRRK